MGTKMQSEKAMSEREEHYNCAPLSIERLRQSADKINESASLGLPCAAWQRGIQLWAADEIERLQTRADLAAERERKLREALKALLLYTRACEDLLNASEAGQCKNARAILAKHEQET